MAKITSHVQFEIEIVKALPASVRLCKIIAPSEMPSIEVILNVNFWCWSNLITIVSMYSDPISADIASVSTDLL